MDDIYDLTQATERTILSDSNDPTISTSTASREASPPDLDIADVWQFVLNAQNLDRFKATSFLPTGTLFGIGEGACYRVDRGELNNEVGGQIVAIKYLKLTEQPSRKLDDVEARRSIETVLRELRILTHQPIRECENIVQLLGYGSRTVGEHISLYLVAEFAAHGTLRDYLGKNKAQIKEKIKFCSDIANGLASLHTCGVANGDVKLENTLVCKDNKGGVIAKLSDFGHSILDDESRYIGTAIFNAPEVRLGRMTSTHRRNHYMCDVFSYGLLIWELLQDGRRYIDPANRKDPLTWLNGLPRDDLLRMALLAVQGLLPADASKVTLLQKILENTLRDDSKNRKTIQEVLKMFNLESAFVAKESKKPEISSFSTSELSTLERWSLYRADAHASTVPFSLQGRVFARLQVMVASHPDPTILGRTLFELGMCYLYGFGVEANTDKMLDLLRQAAELRCPMAMGLCHRLYEAYSKTLPPSFLCDHPMLQAEELLAGLPNDQYFSARIRRHEKLFQQSISSAPFDLFSDESLVAKDLAFDDIDQISNIIGRLDINPSTLVGRTSLAGVSDLGFFLHMAARLGNLPLVRVLVQAGADIHRYHHGSGTPLTSACRGGNPDVVLFLLSMGATAKRVIGKGPMPLHWMIMFEEDKLKPFVKVLQSHDGDINGFSTEVVELREHSMRFVFSPLHFAIQARYYKLAEVLLEAGATTQCGVLTPLDLATSLGFPEFTALFLKHSPSSGLKSPLLHQGLANSLQSFLQHGSSKHSNFESTLDTVLKSKFSDINITGRDGLTPLAYAISGCSCETNLDELEILISRGASLGITATKVVHRLGSRNDGKGGYIMNLLLTTGTIQASPSLLNQACLYGDVDILKSLIDFGIDVNIPDVQEDGAIGALHSSILIPGNYQIIKTLLDHGAEIDALYEGRHAIELAIMQPIADGDVIDLLIERGADLMSPSETTVLHVAGRLASKINGSHILFHLLRHDRVRPLINISSTNENHATPLFMACAGGDIEAIEALIEAGADISTVEEFNPVSLVRVIGRSPDLSPHFKEKDFDFYRHRLRAERTMLMLLDKVNPNHRRTPLHIAALIGNYERVIQLVESGADVWAGDSEKLTPIGLIHEDATNPEHKHTDPGVLVFLENSRKIYEYLELKMIEVAGAATSLEDTKDIFFRLKEFPEEDDTPELLVAKCTERLETAKRDLGEDHPHTLRAMSNLSDAYQLFDDKYAESEALENEVFEKRKAVLKHNDLDLFESRSSHVRLLLNARKLEEARTYAEEYLELSIKLLGDSHHSTDIARLNVSLIDAAEGKVEEALKFQIKLHQRMGSTEGTGFHNRDVIMIQFNIGQTHCGLGQWDDADADVKSLLGKLEFVTNDQYPYFSSSLLILAQAHERHSSWDNAVEIYEKLIEHASKTRGDQSYYTTKARKVLIQLYNKLSNFQAAGDIQLQLVGTAKSHYGLQNLETLQRMIDLADIYQNQERFLEENILRQQVVDISQAMSGESDEATLVAKHALFKILHKRQLFEDAVKVAREVVSGYKETLGEFDPKTIATETELAVLISKTGDSGEAIEKQEKALASLESIHGKINDKVAKALVNLGAMYLRDHRTSDGERVLKRAMAIYEELHGVESLEASSCLAFLAGACINEGRYEQSRDYHEKALEMERKLRGSDNHETLHLMQWLAEDYIALEQVEKAVVLRKEILEGYTKLYGEEHKYVLRATFDLGSSYQSLGDLQQAETLLSQALSGERKILGDSHEETLASIETLGILYASMELWGDAQPLVQEHLVRCVENYGAEHAKTIEARYGLVTVYRSQKMWSEAEEIQREVLEIEKKVKGEDHEDTIEMMDILSEALDQQGKQEECELLNIAILEYRRRILGPENERTLQAMMNLAITYVELEKYAEAADLREEVLEIYRKGGDDTEDFLYMKAELANVYWYQDRLVEAEVLELEIIESRTRISGEDDPATHDALQSLARTYFKQKEYASAEALYFRILKSRQKTLGSLDPEVLRTMKHLEDVYCSMLRWDEAKKYAVVLLDAMKELAPKNDGRGVLSALADMRKIEYRLGNKAAVGQWDSQIIRERRRRGVIWAGTNQIFSTLDALKE